MSLIVKYEDVFQWKSASKMNRKALIEELKRLRKLVEDHYWGNPPIFSISQKWS